MDIIAMYRSGLSVRQISRKLGIHRNTVKKQIETKEFPHYHKHKQGVSILEPYKQIINDYLDQDDYQGTWVFDRIKRIGYPGSYDTVKHYVAGIKEQKTRLGLVIRFETEPGLQAQFDWGDFQVQEPNGKTTTVYAFMIVLGYSRTMYVEFVERCTLDVFMDCHIRAFRYLQGVPAEIFYDNMKNVVIGRENGKVTFNVEVLYFAHHYMFQPMATPPYSPWVKGKVERPIDYLRERFWRGYAFSFIQKANKDVMDWLNETANLRIHGTHHEVVDERWAKEILCLKPLPPGDYDTSLKVFRKVYKDCQLSYNGNRYQVPYHVVGKKVMLKIKGDLIRIYHDQELLISYREPESKNNLIGDPRIYEQLKHDKEQLNRKYGRHKGKATRGLVSKSLYADVIYRPLAEYEKYAKGGVLWNS